ncbi:MAG: hypothetical protein M0C28_18535 [Candidatus Moduliflexus flocculans]|nr:hypothetical protein [Candidatus Moduliflexus flocculans]
MAAVVVTAAVVVVMMGAVVDIVVMRVVVEGIVWVAVLDETVVTLEVAVDVDDVLAVVVRGNVGKSAQAESEWRS